MEYLGACNLFTSHFVIGCVLSDNNNLDVVQTLKDWIHVKDNDWGMKKYTTDRTQFISFPQIIELPKLKLLIKDLISEYKKAYPHAEKDDFLDHIFDYTLFDLDRFISRDYVWMGSIPNNSKFDFYNFYDNDSQEYLDFAVPTDLTIEHLKQYYKRVIKIIKNLPFDHKQAPSHSQPKEKDFRGKIFEINKKNHLALEKEYRFSEDESEFIYRTFWPIIVVNSFSVQEIYQDLINQKRRFIEKYGAFDLEIFKRLQTEFMVYEVTEFIQSLQKGKSRIWDTRNGSHFHWFKLDTDRPNSQTLLISDKDETQLEIYFKNLLIEVENFLKEQERNESGVALPPQQPINPQTDTIKYTTKHYVLAYLFECNATGESFPIGNKKELERIGNKRMGMGKGNRFYKVFNEIINKDLNAENNLIEIGGEDWRKALIELSKAPEMVEEYLQKKQF